MSSDFIKSLNKKASILKLILKGLDVHNYLKMNAMNYQKRKTSTRKKRVEVIDMVEATGFEPAASASRTQRSTKLSHASMPNADQLII